MLPQEMGCGSGVTCWRRLRDWHEAGVWERCDALQQTMSRLCRQAGVKLGSSHSGRRTLARMLAATGNGQREDWAGRPWPPKLDHTKPYLTIDQATIRNAFALVL